MDQQTDEQLMAAVLEGDAPALAQLVHRYHGPLLGYLYHLTGGDRALAEDLAQDTFLRLLQQRSYQVGRPFKPWLYAIATNLLRDHAKAAATRSTVFADEPLELKDDAPDPEALALAAERGNEVLAALGHLGAEYRAALVLRFYAGMRLQEIAATLGVPLGTVKSRLSVGSRRLRDLLAATHPGVEG